MTDITESVRLEGPTSVHMADITMLHERHKAGATAERPPDIAYRTIDSPVGKMLIASTVDGILRVAFDSENHERVLEDLAKRVSSRILRAPKQLDDAASQLEEYFSGRRRSFELPLDWRLASGFRRTVLRHLAMIGYGDTESYTEVAAAAGSQRAVRAVGTACATNPLPIIIPCHRVLRSDGSLGGYLGGLAAKRTLLSLEGA